jgi:hypothetical protein
MTEVVTDPAPVAEESKTLIETVTDGIAGYIDAVIDQPIQHGMTFLFGMALDRRLVTSAAKKELSEAAYGKVKAKIPGGSIPFFNA